MLSLKIKIKLNSDQKIKLETLSNEHRLLYNYLLDNIKDKSLTFKELNQLYVKYRHNNQLTISSKSSQNTCINLINNIKSFYELKKKDVTAKFPYKFKSYKYFTSFTQDYNKGMGGFKISDNKLMVNLLDSSQNLLKKLVINLPKYCLIINNENIKTITFKRENENDYYVIFVYSETPSKNKLDKKNFMSIDLGYSNLVTSYSNKMENIQIKNLKLKKLEKTIEKLQSIKDKKKKYSNKYNKINNRFKKQKRKLSNKVIDFQHKVSTYIINECVKNDIGSLIVGDIKVKKIICKENKKLSGISKSTLSLGRFKDFLEYKAKKSNMDHYHVNEAYTSQQNCLTGEIMFSSDLSNRIVEVSKGLFIDRDLNSAINIGKKCRGVWFTHDLDLNLNQMYYNVSNDTMIRVEI
jgi:IS605 OrfB family transposase